MDEDARKLMRIGNIKEICFRRRRNETIFPSKNALGRGDPLSRPSHCQIETFSAQVILLTIRILNKFFHSTLVNSHSIINNDMAIKHM